MMPPITWPDFEKVDLRDQPEVRRVVRDHAITHVLHLAAESHVDRSIAGPAAFIHTNVVGTFHLLEACREVWPAGAADRRWRTLWMMTGMSFSGNW